MCAVYNLAATLPTQWCRLQGQGVHSSTVHSIKEETRAIYTSQVYNHGFHVVLEQQSCNLKPPLCSTVCCKSLKAQEQTHEDVYTMKYLKPNSS